MIHVDHPWSECAKNPGGAPFRIYIRNRWGFWTIGAKTQVYDRKTKKYTDRWAYITHTPPNK